MESYNGHIVVKNIPGPLITFVNGKDPSDKTTVKCIIDFPGGPADMAYICLGTNCCKYRNPANTADSKTDWEKSVYDIMLVDEEYTVYFPEKDVSSGIVTIFPTDGILSKNEVAEALNQAAMRYKKDPIKPKGSLFKKPDPIDRKMACPVDMINPYDVPNLPGSWE